MDLATLPLTIDPAGIAAFCRARGIRALRLFGSVLRNDFTPASDVDVLVEYLPGRHPGLDFFSHQDDLSALLGRSVDLHTRASLSKYFQAEAVRDSLPLYEQA